MAGGRSVEVARYEPTDRFPIVTLVGFATRDDAEQIRGRALYIESRARRPLGANEFWPDQLQGLPVVAREGTTIGVVVDVETGLSQDRLLVDTGDGVLMIPLVAALVPEVDLHGGRVVVDLPAGFTEEG
jgi:16S rRNA processing protein RimM